LLEEEPPPRPDEGGDGDWLNDAPPSADASVAAVGLAGGATLSSGRADEGGAEEKGRRRCSTVVAVTGT
jgi:hypothetical protein